MKILLTGYKGFIGKNFLKNDAFMDHDIDLLEIDEDLPNISQYNWVIHLGAMSSTTTSIEDAMKYNYEFTIKLYEECRKGYTNLQYASSASVYGSDNTTFKEYDTPNPQSPYAWSKYLIERYIQENPADNITVQGFRYFNVFGPNENHKGNMASPIHQFTKQARETGVIKIFEGSENCKRDFVPVDKVISTHLKFLEIDDISGVFNVGTGYAKSFRAVAEDIAKQYNAKIEEIPFPEHLKNQYQYYTCADMELTKKVLFINKLTF